MKKQAQLGMKTGIPEAKVRRRESWLETKARPFLAWLCHQHWATLRQLALFPLTPVLLSR